MSKITIDRAVVEQALEDICGAKLCEINSMSSRHEMLRLMEKSASALRAVLNQPLEQNKSDNYLNGYCTGRTELLAEQSVEQEPVAYQDTGNPYEVVPIDQWENIDPAWYPTYRPLYTHPQPRQPLTDEALSLIGSMVSELRAHRYCGDCYPENGWPDVNKVLADYADFKRAHGIVGEK